MVKIKATGFGATALQNGIILHFDAEEAKKPKGQQDKRKLEADVELVDAKRIQDLGWGKIVGDVDEEEDRAELGDEVAKLEVAPEPEQGKPSQEAPRADRDDPAANAHRLATGGQQPRAKRPSELAKAAAKTAGKKAGKAPAAPAAADPAADGGAGAPVDPVDPNDPEAGPATT